MRTLSGISVGSSQAIVILIQPFHIVDEVLGRFPSVTLATVLVTSVHASTWSIRTVLRTSQSIIFPKSGNQILGRILLGKIKTIHLPRGQNIDPSMAKHSVSPIKSNILVWNAWSSRLTRAPQGCSTLPCPLLAELELKMIKEIQGYRQVCSAWHGGPRTPSRTTDANLDCVCFKKER